MLYIHPNESNIYLGHGNKIKIGPLDLRQYSQELNSFDYDLDELRYFSRKRIQAQPKSNQITANDDCWYDFSQHSLTNYQMNKIILEMKKI